VYAKLLRAKGVRPKDYLLLTILPSVDFFALSVAAFAVGESATYAHVCKAKLGALGREWLPVPPSP